MTDYTVSAGQTFASAILYPNENLNILGGGTASNCILFSAEATVHEGGVAELDYLTDSALEYDFGQDRYSIIADGGFLYVEADGSTLEEFVHAGGVLHVVGIGSAGNPVGSGVAVGTTVFTGGRLEIYALASATGTTLSGGTMLLAWGDATGTVIRGGVELVSGYSTISGYAFAVDSGATVSSGGLQQVVASGLAQATIVSFGGSAVAESAGVISGAVVSSGGMTIERFGGIASGTTLIAGATDTVSSNGSAVAAIIESGGREYVSGGLATGATVYGGGLQIVVSSGLAQATSLVSGGQAIAETDGLLSGAVVGSGGMTIERYFGLASGATLLSGGADVVRSTASATSATVSKGGLQTVAGGVAIATTVGSGGSQSVLAGGVASGTRINAGGFEYVRSGGLASGAFVSSGGAESVSSGGVASNTQIASGGMELLYAGGRLSSATVSGGGVFELFGPSIGSGATLSARMMTTSATVSGAVLLSGATLNTVSALVQNAGVEAVGSGAKANRTTVSSGGQLSLLAGGVASGTVLAGGSETIASGAKDQNVAMGGAVTDNGALTFSGTTTFTNTATFSGAGMVIEKGPGMVVFSGVQTAFTGSVVISAGTVELATSTGIGSASVTFASPAAAATLQIDVADTPANGGTFADTLINFNQPFDILDLRGVTFVNGATAVRNGSTLVFTDNGYVCNFKLGGTVGAVFVVSSDGHGGTQIVDPPAKHLAIIQAMASLGASTGYGPDLIRASTSSSHRLITGPALGESSSGWRQA